MDSASRSSKGSALDQTASGAQSKNLMSPPSMSTVDSTDDDVFSVSSRLTATNASTMSRTSAFAQGWKAAMHQTSTERPPAYSDLDRFALELTETLDAWLAKGQKLNQTGTPLKPDAAEIELFFPALFRSICVCDVSIMGNPIALHSKHFELSPRGLRVGQAQFLNLPRDTRNLCNLSVRAEKGRETQYILEFSNDLVSAEGNRKGYVIATQMDVSTSIRSIAEVLNAKFWMTHRNDSAEGENDNENRRSHPSAGVDWRELAQERPESSHNAYDGLRTVKEDLIWADSTVMEFCEMIEDIRYFHKDYFSLTVGQEATGSEWKISHLSPSLKNRIEDVRASFSQTEPAAMIKLGTILSGESADTVLVKWGANAELKRLYCCPMFRDVKACWICFLARADESNLWDLNYSTTPSP
ncbi:MAG: hypothetical protein Q9162_004521 [Coniocarpon cinnabarinum]